MNGFRATLKMSRASVRSAKALIGINPVGRIRPPNDARPKCRLKRLIMSENEQPTAQPASQPAETSQPQSTPEMPPLTIPSADFDFGDCIKTGPVPETRELGE